MAQTQTGHVEREVFFSRLFFPFFSRPLFTAFALSLFWFCHQPSFSLHKRNCLSVSLYTLLLLLLKYGIPGATRRASVVFFSASGRVRRRRRDRSRERHVRWCVFFLFSLSLCSRGHFVIPASSPPSRRRRKIKSEKSY